MKKSRNAPEHNAGKSIGAGGSNAFGFPLSPVPSFTFSVCQAQARSQGPFLLDASHHLSG